MATIDRNPAPTADEVDVFLGKNDFRLPEGLIEFFSEVNGADIVTDEKYIFLWALTDMVQLNEEYKVADYAPEFFIFGSDGGNIAFAIEKITGDIYEMPFIGMSRKEAILKDNNFIEFLESV